MDKTIVYLDHAATTPAEEAVIRAMADCMRGVPCNASAAYGAAGDARRVHRLCRRQLADMLACPPEDIYFTSGGTEANNWVIRAFAGSAMAVSAIEHHSVLRPAQSCASSLTLIPPDQTGYVSPEALESALRPGIKLLCLQAANNETGVLQPLREAYALARARGVHLHVDAVAAFGHIPLYADCCDSMSLSAHKFYGPRGVGALYLRGGKRLSPLMLGGSQERGMRAGTENTPAICGLHVAARLAQDDLHLRAERERALLSAFVSRLEASVPGLVQLGKDRPRLPGVAALMLPAVSAEYAIAKLDLAGVLVSGGAACASKDGAPSHVFTAMGLPAQDALHVIRVSVGRPTTAAARDAAAAAIEALIPPPAR